MEQALGLQGILSSFECHYQRPDICITIHEVTRARLGAKPHSNAMAALSLPNGLLTAERALHRGRRAKYALGKSASDTGNHSASITLGFSSLFIIHL